MSVSFFPLGSCASSGSIGGKQARRVKNEKKGSTREGADQVGAVEKEAARELETIELQRDALRRDVEWGLLSEPSSMTAP
jgi:hypothetical protein